MSDLLPRLDHLVVDARDRMDEAARAYRSLGFHLTERSRHTLGSVNRLAVFENDYLELLGFDEGKVRADIQAWPVGLNGLVFGLKNPEELHAELQGRGVAVDEPQSFSRPVNLGQGMCPDAKFEVVRLRAGTASFGRVYFCHHLTPELIWRREWQQHPNGALSIARVLIAVREPDAPAELLRRMFGQEAVRTNSDGGWTLAAGSVEVVLAGLATIQHRFGEAAPDKAGRADYMAALTVRTASLAAAAQALEAGGITGRVEARRILVPAAAAMNVAIEFVE
jgi:hypothetical protein